MLLNFNFQKGTGIFNIFSSTAKTADLLPQMVWLEFFHRLCRDRESNSSQFSCTSSRDLNSGRFTDWATPRPWRVFNMTRTLGSHPKSCLFSTTMTKHFFVAQQKLNFLSGNISVRKKSLIEHKRWNYRSSASFTPPPPSLNVLLLLLP